VAEHKRDQARRRKEELFARKQQLKDEIAAKKDKLFEMVGLAKDVQNRSV